MEDLLVVVAVSGLIGAGLGVLGTLLTQRLLLKEKRQRDATNVVKLMKEALKFVKHDLLMHEHRLTNVFDLEIDPTATEQVRLHIGDLSSEVVSKWFGLEQSIKNLINHFEFESQDGTMEIILAETGSLSLSLSGTRDAIGELEDELKKI